MNTNRSSVLTFSLGAALAGLAACTSLLKPPPPEIPDFAVYVDTVKRGPMTVQAWGLGTLKRAGHAKLNADVRFPALFANDIHPGQTVSLDTHHGIFAGRVAEVHPVDVNGVFPVVVSVSGSLPKEVREGSQITGTIDIDKLNDVLYIGRPVFGQINSNISLFKVGPSGFANRTKVKLGKGSVDYMQVIDGLKEGDRAIVSDMSSWDSFDQILIVHYQH